MIRHFTYEIDERNLRVKVKNMELPLKEGAWESFEEYSMEQSKHGSDGGMAFKFSLNRNVMILAVFGAVILSFSLLLFNFITIKNPKGKPFKAWSKIKRWFPINRKHCRHRGPKL